MKLNQTEATILSAELGSGQSQYRSQSGGYNQRTSFFPNISYRYEVNGKEYVNDQYAQRASLVNRRSLVERTVKKYPVGSKVTVFYDPQDPQVAYLEKGYGASGAIIAVVLVASLLFTAALIAVLWATGAF